MKFVLIHLLPNRNGLFEFSTIGLYDTKEILEIGMSATFVRSEPNVLGLFGSLYSRLPFLPQVLGTSLTALYAQTATKARMRDAVNNSFSP